jgi:hypothetical protein
MTSSCCGSVAPTLLDFSYAIALRLAGAACCALASPRGARIQASRSSSVVKIIGIALAKKINFK